MTTVKETVKELTKSRYEFYKTQVKPLSDSAIRKIYNMTQHDMNKFKAEHDLIGKQYEPNTSSNSIRTFQKSEQPPETKQAPEIPLLKENDIEEIRKNEVQKKLSAQIAQKQPQEPVQRMETITPKETPADWTQFAETKPQDKSCEWQELKAKIERLQEENAYLKQGNDEKQAEIHAANLRGDRWRDEKLALLAEFEAFEQEAAERLEREKYGSHRIESALKKEIGQLEAALEHHAKDEQLALLLSEKFVSMGRRLQDA